MEVCCGAATRVLLPQLPPLGPASPIPRKSGYILIHMAVSANFSCMVRHNLCREKTFSIVVAVVVFVGGKKITSGLHHSFPGEGNGGSRAGGPGWP